MRSTQHKKKPLRISLACHFSMHDTLDMMYSFQLVNVHIKVFLFMLL